MAIVDRPTVRRVAASKSVSDEYVENVRAALQRILRTDFGNNQSRAAKSLHLSQSQISELLSAKAAKGIGMRTVTLIADYTKQSIDDLIGRRRPKAHDDFELALVSAQAGLDDGVESGADLLPKRAHAASVVMRSPRYHVPVEVVRRILESERWNALDLLDESVEWWVREFLLLRDLFAREPRILAAGDEELWDSVRDHEEKEVHQKQVARERATRRRAEALAAHDAEVHPAPARRKKPTAG